MSDSEQAPVEHIENVVVESNNTFYKFNELIKEESIFEIGRDALYLDNIYGFDNNMNQNLHFLDFETIIYATTAGIIIQNITSNHRIFLTSLDEGGVGCIAVHPSK